MVGLVVCGRRGGRGNSARPPKLRARHVAALRIASLEGTKAGLIPNRRVRRRPGPQSIARQAERPRVPTDNHRKSRSNDGSGQVRQHRVDSHLKMSNRAKLRENNTRHIHLLGDLEDTPHSCEERKLDGENTRSINEHKAVTGPNKARIADVHGWAHRPLHVIITTRDSVARIERMCILVACS